MLHVGLDGDGVGVGLTLRHLRLRQRLEFGFDQCNLLLSTVHCPASLQYHGACTQASRGRVPADVANGLSVIGTGRIAAVVPFGEAVRAAVRRDPGSTLLA